MKNIMIFLLENIRILSLIYIVNILLIYIIDIFVPTLVTVLHWYALDFPVSSAAVVWNARLASKSFANDTSIIASVAIVCYTMQLSRHQRPTSTSHICQQCWPTNESHGRSLGWMLNKCISPSRDVQRKYYRWHWRAETSTPTCHDGRW